MNNLEEFKEFIDWFVDLAGQNYGYNLETSTENKISQEVMVEIYKQLWIKYGINDLFMYSELCDTCREKDPTKPFHFDANKILSPNQFEKINKQFWTNERIKEEESLWNSIQLYIQNLQPRENATEIREAYSLFNLIERTGEGYELYSKIQILRSEIETVKKLNIQKINQAFKRYKHIIIEVDVLEKDRKYQLT